MAEHLPGHIGSATYDAGEVWIMLRAIEIPSIPTYAKERLMQSGVRHYSEMFTCESEPEPWHQQAYQDALDRHGSYLARQVQALAQTLVADCAGQPLVLVSLVRAGLPVGVLLRRALLDLGAQVTHYGVSIIHDRGLDQVALQAILQRHPPEQLAFVDGWTGKGAIADELARSLAQHGRFKGLPRLVVLADPCGKAWLAATSDDWLIPSGMLGPTISGQLSRTIWSGQHTLHGCVRYSHLDLHDVSQDFIEHIDSLRRELPAVPAAKAWTSEQRDAMNRYSARVIGELVRRFSLRSAAHVKPGLAEATRALLRRVPEQVLVRDLSDPDTHLLVELARRNRVEVHQAPELLGPYRAVTLVRGFFP